jgi:sugar phosphate permease
MQDSGARRRKMAALVLASGSIYLLPYMRQSYKLPMCRALGLSATELGAANSAFGFAAMASYVPGGVLADLVSPRVLLTLSLVVTALAGLFMATLPGYGALVTLHVLMGVSTIMTFWPALIRATRDLAPPEGQGRAFGILEGGRGLVETLVGWGGVALFSWMASGARGLATVMLLYSVAPLALAILVWVWLGPAEVDGGPRQPLEPTLPRGGGVRLLFSAARLPVVWLLAGVIFAAYSNFWGGFDIASFGEHGFGMSAAFAATLSTFRMGFRIVAPVLAGLVADRTSASGSTSVLFMVLLLSFGLFAVMPTGTGWGWLLWVNTAVAAVPIFGLRGIYYALLEEGRIPGQMTGSATGIISFLGYVPDALAPLINGVLLDSYPGARGHRYYYTGMAAAAALGLLATLAVRRLVRRRAARVEP